MGGEYDFLSEDDLDFLNRSSLSYSAHQEQFQGNSETHIILHDFPLPEAYTPSSTNILIRLPTGYPAAGVDMFWTDPWVKLKSGGDPRQCSAPETYCGKTWQRWSRHNQSWRAYVDNLETIVASIRKNLKEGI